MSGLKEIAGEIRISLLQMAYHAGCGHTGGSLSEVDILTVLYFYIMKINPTCPDWPERDRFILSKGHATPGYYATLAKKGFFPEDKLRSFDAVGSILQGHPDMHKTPGVDISSGSLGQGLSVGIGMALGCVANHGTFYTYVLLGDGECQEGQVWEAAMYAGAHGVKRIIAIVDYNKVQLASKTAEATGLEPISDKWQAFKWKVIECNGHDMGEIVTALTRAQELSKNGPVVIIAHTVKGKGVSFMENKWQWHGKAPNEKEFSIAIRELTGKEPV